MATAPTPSSAPPPPGEPPGRDPGPTLRLDPSMGATKRWLYFGLGWLFFVLGLIGAVLPVMPTTPFLILALWAFSISSRRFHDWLYHHRLFGPRLQDWHRARVIPLPIKLTAWGGMLCSLALMALVIRVAWPALVAAAAVMGFGAIFIARCPSRPPAPADPPAPARPRGSDDAEVDVRIGGAR